MANAATVRVFQIRVWISVASGVTKCFIAVKFAWKATKYFMMKPALA